MRHNPSSEAKGKQFVHPVADGIILPIPGFFFSSFLSCLAGI